jgi:hypothetical protein
MDRYNTGEIILSEVRTGGMPKHIRGVRCEVRGCSYHDGDSFCCADRISIGPSFANNSGETVCATFKPRSDVTRPTIL